MPEIGLLAEKNTAGISEYKLSKYVFLKNRFIKKTIKLDINYQGISVIPDDELLIIFDTKSDNNFITENCKLNYCDSDFSRFFMK
jgi:hypothetical protein